MFTGELDKMGAIIVSQLKYKKVLDDYKRLLKINTNKLKSDILRTIASQVSLETDQLYQDSLTSALDLSCLDAVLESSSHCRVSQ